MTFRQLTNAAEIGYDTDAPRFFPGEASALVNEIERFLRKKG